MAQSHYKDLYDNVRIQRDLLEIRVSELESALRKLDELRHRLKKTSLLKILIRLELIDIIQALKKPCMVLYK